MVGRGLHMCANRKFSMSEQFEQAEPSYTSYHMMGGESTSIPPDSPHQITSSTTATAFIPFSIFAVPSGLFHTYQEVVSRLAFSHVLEHELPIAVLILKFAMSAFFRI